MELSPPGHDVKMLISRCQQVKMLITLQCCRCRRYPLQDVEEQEIVPFFSQATDFINEAQQSGGKLLLHCHEGKSRSITLALAYLMQTKHWTLKQALEFVTEARPCASPNAGFMTQLLTLEEKLHGQKTVKVSCVTVLSLKHVKYINDCFLTCP